LTSNKEKMLLPSQCSLTIHNHLHISFKNKLSVTHNFIKFHPEDVHLKQDWPTCSLRGMYLRPSVTCIVSVIQFSRCFIIGIQYTIWQN